MFDDIEIEEYKSHQHKSPISLSNIDINKTVISSKFSFGKQINISWITKMLKKLNLYAYSIQK